MSNLQAGRNEPCPCGSGRKYKKCCLFQQAKRAASHNAIGLVQSVRPSLQKSDSSSAPTFWNHPPNQPDASPPVGEEWVEYYFVIGKGWTHESELKPGDQYRLKGGGWGTVEADHLIRTTEEHPFFVRGKGWTPLGEIQPGEWIRTDNGWVEVKGVTDTGRYATVYNLRVSDFHTYFVGKEDWGFAVWAHNTYNNRIVAQKGPAEFVDPDYVGPARFPVAQRGDLPKAVRNRLQEIESGNPQLLHPAHDQAPYKNKLYGSQPRPLLPDEGSYLEYYVTGAKGDGRRIIIDQNSGMAYYTPDHHQTFVAIEMPWMR